MANTERKCVIHIGAPKTGSTALQRYMTENIDILRDNDLLYCSTGIRGFGHHDVAFLLYGQYPDWAISQPKSLEELSQGIKEECSRFAGTTILSSENFYIYPQPRGVRTFLNNTGLANGRTVKIVVYLRRQDNAHESWYNQTIKAQGATHSIESCIEHYHEMWDYPKMLAPWIEEFGKDALIVRIYKETEDRRKFNIVEDFLYNVIGGRYSSLPSFDIQVNSNINRDIIEFQRIINTLHGSPVEKRIFHRDLIELSTITKGKEIFDEGRALSVSRRAKIVAKYADGNRELAQIFLGRNNLFQNNIHDTGEVIEEYKGLTVKKYLKILSWLNTRGDMIRITNSFSDYP